MNERVLTVSAAVRLKIGLPPEKNPVLSWRNLAVSMDEYKEEVLDAKGYWGTTSLQCWVYRVSVFEFWCRTRDSEVVVGVLAMNTKTK